MCAVEAQRCVDCVSAVLHAVLRRDSQGAFRRRQACLAFLDQLRPCGRSTYLSTTTTETLADSPLGSDWRMVQLLNLGRTVLGPNYCQRARRSSPGPAPDPARRRLADIA
jgi:hypothetical protein